MAFQKTKSDTYGIGGRHRPATKKVYGDITSKSSKVLIGDCSICSRKKSMTVSDSTTEAEGLRHFFMKLG